MAVDQKFRFAKAGRVCDRSQQTHATELGNNDETRNLDIHPRARSRGRPGARR
jgi:hypothetical protein